MMHANCLRELAAGATDVFSESVGLSHANLKDTVAKHGVIRQQRWRR